MSYVGAATMYSGLRPALGIFIGWYKQCTYTQLIGVDVAVVYKQCKCTKSISVGVGVLYVCTIGVHDCEICRCVTARGVCQCGCHIHMLRECHMLVWRC